MAEQIVNPPPMIAVPLTATGFASSFGPNQRIAGETLPPDLMHLAEGPMADALAKAVGYAKRSLSPRTEKIYEDNWKAFEAWCLSHSAPSLPAAPAIVAAYLVHRASTLGKSGLNVALASIAHRHRKSGHIWQKQQPVIAAVKSGILRTKKQPVRPASAIGSAEIRRLLVACKDDPGGAVGLPGLRDRALLLLCFAGGLRRSELVALDHADLAFVKDGLILTIRQSKADQEGEGATVRIAKGSYPHTCPVRTMDTWLKRSKIRFGPVFPRVTAGGTLLGRLTGNGVWKILRRLAADAGLKAEDGERLSPHGMRAGFITEAYLHGALDEQVMAHARQKDVNTTRRYRNRVKTVAASPTRLLDL